MKQKEKQLEAFLDTVSKLFKELDAGNAEQSPPYNSHPMSSEISRYDYAWKEMDAVKKSFGLDGGPQDTI